MNTQFVDQLFIENFVMVNIEITFEGVRSWFQMAGTDIDDATIFRALLQPEKIESDLQTQILRMVLYRYEDVFFQANRNGDSSEPFHQLLIRMMNVRTLHGEQEALIDLGLALQQDKLRTEPIYRSLHCYFG